MENKEHVWRAVPGFEEMYEVTSCGIVKSIDRVSVSDKREPQRIKGRVLRPGRASSGYLSVVLCKSGVGRSYNIHEIVAAAFIGPRPEKYDIDHVDGDRQNNRVENLRYVPHVTNTRNITKINARSGRLGVYPNGKRWMAQIMTDGVTKTLGTFATIDEADAARKEYERAINFRGLAEPA